MNFFDIRRRMMLAGGVNPKFTITDGSNIYEYEFEGGMTWSDFVASKYNNGTYKFYSLTGIGSTYYPYFRSRPNSAIFDGDTVVKSSDIIQNGKVYNRYSFNGVLYNAGTIAKGWSFSTYSDISGVSWNTSGKLSFTVPEATDGTGFRFEQPDWLYMSYSTLNANLANMSSKQVGDYGKATVFAHINCIGSSGYTSGILEASGTSLKDYKGSLTRISMSSTGSYVNASVGAKYWTRSGYGIDCRKIWFT